MIQINLLPTSGGRSAPDDRQFLLIYATCVVLTLATIAYLWVSQTSQISTSTRRLAEVRRQVSHYAKYDRMLKDLKRKLALIDEKTAVVKNLEKDRDMTVRALALLSAEMPADKMWFEKLKQSHHTMSLNGVALSNEAIAEFMRNLESSPYIQKGSVSLRHSRRISMSKRKLREFQMNYSFYPFSALPKAHAAKAAKQPG